MAEDPQEAERILTSLSEQARALSGLRGSPSRIRVRSGDAAIEVEWSSTPVNGTAPMPVHVPAAKSVIAEPDGPQPGTLAITSPMVGTFYRAPEPGAEPYVSIGDEVEQGRVIGVVEAMKLMNPVVAEHAGKVAEILVGNAEPVQFGQALVTLAPAGPAHGEQGG